MCGDMQNNMTYNVFGGTLNLSQLVIVMQNTSLISDSLIYETPFCVIIYRSFKNQAVFCSSWILFTLK